jgi:hypothetical protein
MNRTWTAVIGIGLAGVATGTLVAAGMPAGAASDNHHTLDLVASAPTSSLLAIPCQDCVQFSQPDGAHIGGTEYDAGLLTDHGHNVGHFSLVSIGVTPFAGEDKPGELQLTAMAVINGDQLIGQGLEEPPLNGGTLAVTGGTGRFLGAQGILRYTDNQDGSTTLHIELKENS